MVDAGGGRHVGGCRKMFRKCNKVALQYETIRKHVSEENNRILKTETRRPL